MPLTLAEFVCARAIAGTKALIRGLYIDILCRYFLFTDKAPQVECGYFYLLHAVWSCEKDDR